MPDNTDAFMAESMSGSADADSLYDAACYKEFCVAFPGIAHDMRGFLNNMALNFELLKGMGGADSAGHAERYRDAGLQQIRNMDKYLRWVIELLDREDVPPQTVDINALSMEIHAMVKSYARHARKNVTWKVLDTPVMIQARLPELRRALMHVVLTAIRATASDGKLEMELKCAHAYATLTLCGEWASGQQLALASVFAGETPGHDLSYLTLIKARKILSSIGGGVEFIRSGEGMMISITLRPVIAG